MLFFVILMLFLRQYEKRKTWTPTSDAQAREDCRQKDGLAQKSAYSGSRHEDSGVTPTVTNISVESYVFSGYKADLLL